MSDRSPIHRHSTPVPPGLQGESGHARELVFYGGSGSSKSTSGRTDPPESVPRHEAAPRSACSSPEDGLSALKNTLLVDCIRILQALGGLTTGIEHNQKTSRFMLFGKNRIDFLGLDNPEKIEGCRNYTHIWLEEATDFDLEDVRTAPPPSSAGTTANENARYIFTFNPDRRTALDLDRSGAGLEAGRRRPPLDVPGTTSATSRRSWIGRPPCSRRAGRELLTASTRSANPAFLQTRSFTPNYRVADYPVPVSGLRRHRLRLQQRRPAITGIKQLSDRLQVWEILYQSRMTNTDLIAWLKARAGIWYISGDTPLYADSAEPNRIEEIRRAGFNARPADKSVKEGIDFCKAQALEVHSSAANLIPGDPDLQVSRRPSAAGSTTSRSKFNDHAMDAMRYAAYLHFGQRRDVKYPEEWLSFGGAR